MPTDLAFAGDTGSWVHDVLPLVDRGQHARALDRSPSSCARASSRPSDDADADSWERQRDDFDAEALHIATRLLVSDDEARRTSIAAAVARELFWLIPHDRGADIAVRDRRVTVTLGEPAAGAVS